MGTVGLRATQAAAAAAAVVLAACGGEGGAVGGSPQTRAERARDAPNVIVVMTDDQDAASIRHMPNVQRLLVAEGTTFANSFVSDPLCCPSRATFLTGQYAHNHGVLSNQAPEGGYRRLRATNTLAVWLRRAGYRTALVGRYLNGYGVGPTLPGRPPGWTSFQALLEPAFRYFRVTLNDNGVRRDYPPGTYQTDVLASRAVRFIRGASTAQRPFFLWLTPAAPHAPALAAPQDRGRSAGVPVSHSPSFDEADVSDKPAFIRKLPRLAPPGRASVDRHYRQRLNSLQAVDRAVARIVSTLGDVGELERTVIFFTSDNGWMSGEHRLPSGKRVAYEESIRVPLIVRGPGYPRRARREALVANIDLAPTIAALAGARPGLHMDGCSLLPLARNEEARWRRDLLFESLEAKNLEREGDVLTSLPKYAAVRSGPYKYIEYETGERELYDLRSDPFELRNLASDPVVARTRRALAKRLARLRAGAPQCRLFAPRSG